MDSRIKKNRIYKILDLYDEKLIDFYINRGPYKLRKKLKIESDDVWKVVLNYLFYEKDVIKHLIKSNVEYIHEVFAEKGPKALRKAFDAEDPIYDEAWEYVMDYIGISRGALYEYINNEISKFRNLIYKGKTSKIRESLCIDKQKYLRVWEEILDILLGAVSTNQYSYSMYEQGLRMFINLYNLGRKHRSLKEPEVKEIPISEEED